MNMIEKMNKVVLKFVCGVSYYLRGVQNECECPKWECAFMEDIGR
jgi:hypothetical protein